MTHWQPMTLSGDYRQQRIPRDNGTCCDLSVWCPDIASGHARLPVVYVLDGADLFLTVAEATRRLSRRPEATHVGPAVVVGIEANGHDRSLDFTPGPPAEEAIGKRSCGGAGDFMSFLCDQVIPLVEQDFPVDPRHRSLLGHSLAGYFTLQALAARPECFADFIAISPSIWWNEAGLLADLAAAELSDQRVFLASGEWEAQLAPWQQQQPRAVEVQQRRQSRATPERCQRMADHLQQRLGANRVTCRQFPDEDHASTVLVATARALRDPPSC